MASTPISFTLLAALLLCASCDRTSTLGPAVAPEEIAAEKAAQDRAIVQAQEQGGTPRLWRSKKRMNEQFERVAARVEKAGAQLCRDMGLPAKKRSCYYYFELAQGADINAHADGKAVFVNTGMMRFVENDDELGAIIGHEMAHNMMNHHAAKSTNALIGAALGGAIDAVARYNGANTQGGFANAGSDLGGLSYSPEFEREADYVGLYIAARAGYDIRRASQYWRRLSVQEPDSENGGLTHPSNPERAVSMRKTIEEIEYKRAHRLPLVPESKPAE